MIKEFAVKKPIVIMLLCTLILCLIILFTGCNEEQIKIEFTIPEDNLGVLITVNGEMVEFDKSLKLISFDAMTGDSIVIHVETFKRIEFIADNNYSSKIKFFEESNEQNIVEIKEIEITVSSDNVPLTNVECIINNVSHFSTIGKFILQLETQTYQIIFKKCGLVIANEKIDASRSNSFEIEAHPKFKLAVLATTESGEIIENVNLFIDNQPVKNGDIITNMESGTLTATSEFYEFEKITFNWQDSEIILIGKEKNYTIKVYAVNSDGSILDYPFFYVNGELMSNSNNGIFVGTFGVTFQGKVTIDNSYGIFEVSEINFSYMQSEIIFRAIKYDTVQILLELNDCYVSPDSITISNQLQRFSYFETKGSCIYVSNYLPTCIVNIECSIDNVKYFAKVQLSYGITNYIAKLINI